MNFKHKKGIFIILTFVFFLFLQQNSIVKAETIDNLKATITTEKQSYNEDEEIKYNITIANNSGTKAKNVVVTNALPNELEIIDTNARISGNNLIWNIDNIEEYGQVTLSFTSKVKIKDINPPQVDSNNNNSNNVTTNTSTNTISNTPKTGDSTSLYKYLILLIIFSIIFICSLRAYKSKKLKKEVTMLLIFTFVTFLFTSTIAKAEEIKETIKATHKLTINNKDYINTVTVEATFSTEKPVLSIEENNGSFMLRWNKITKDKSYKLYRTIGGEEKLIFTTDNTVNQYLDNDKSTFGTYKYKLVAEYAQDHKEASNIVSGLYNDYGIGVLDNDSDGDGLSDEQEKKLETDYLKDDTDGDGVNDGYEYYILGTSPLKVDSDNNGINDANEDFDSDKLVNKEEYKFNTNPYKSDTDMDKINDYDEINIYKTNPYIEDTDKDGLSDGDEIILGFNPNIPDTDKDGILDSDEITKQKINQEIFKNVSKDSNQAIPSLTVNSAGNINDTIRVCDESNNPLLKDNRAIVGKPINIECDTKINSAELSFKIDNSVSIDNLTIYWYDEVNKRSVPLETKVDKTNNTISAELEHFSIYYVVDNNRLVKELGKSNKGSNSSGQADIVFVIDSTGSMGDEINNVKANINNFVTDLINKNVNCNLALIQYKDITEPGEEKSTKVNKNGNSNWFVDPETFKTSISKIDVSGGGDYPETLVDALEEAVRLDYRTTSDKYIIVLTDADYKIDNRFGIKSIDETINSLKNKGIKTSIITKESLVEQTYKTLHSSTNGIWGNIDANFSEVLKKLIGLIDETSSDGYWIMLDMSKVKLKKKPEFGDEKTDTDGDGVPDYKELVMNEPLGTLKVKQSDGSYIEYERYKFYSNPGKVDTDEDGINDLKDINPLVKFINPIILLHGRTDNTEYCFGVKNNIAKGNNDNYGKEEDNNGKKYTDVYSQSIIKLKNVIGGDSTPVNLSQYLDTSQSKINKSLFALNYPNQDMVNVNAGYLKNYIQNLVNSKLGRYKAESRETQDIGYLFASTDDIKNNNYKFDLIGHSMGGLVSRYYIENLEQSSHVRKLITIDTPHWGSGLANVADAIDLTLINIPCDIDLQPSAKIFGGDHQNFVSLINSYRAKYINDHQTEALNLSHSGVKYYAIAGYDDNAPHLLPKDLKNKNLMFDVNLDSKDFSSFRNSIAEGFYSTYGYRDSIIFDFTKIGGDNVVNNQSQFGVKYNSSDKLDKKLDIYKYSMNIDTFFGHSLFNIFHSQNQHREEVCDKVIKYLGE